MQCKPWRWPVCFHLDDTITVLLYHQCLRHVGLTVRLGEKETANELLMQGSFVPSPFLGSM